MAKITVKKTVQNSATQGGSKVVPYFQMGWDVMDALELLSGFLQKFGGIIDFTGSDLAEGLMDLVGVGPSIPKDEVIYRLMFRPKSSEHAADTKRVATMVEKRHEEV